MYNVCVSIKYIKIKFCAKETKKNESESKVGGEEEGEASGQVTASAQDQDDEFVSDSHQVHIIRLS